MSLAHERRAARERALGLLYEAEAKGVTGAAVLADLPVPPDEFTTALVEAVDEHRERIDGLLEQYAQDWTLARMAALDRAALRMGTAELIARADVPTGVVLAETVDLASRFSTDGSGRFVNGLLARVAQEVRGAGSAPTPVDDGPELEPHVAGLVIDLDGVIRHWDPTYYPEAEERLGLPGGTLTAVALQNERLERVVDGRLPFEGWCEEVGAEVADAHGVDASAVADAWATTTWSIDLSVMELIAAARERVPVVLLSNASTRLLHDVEQSGILDAFDAVVGSADIRCAKPDAAAFAAAASAIGLTPDQCAFVDDTPVNVEAARALGMQAALYVGVEELHTLLVELELVP